MGVSREEFFSGASPLVAISRGGEETGRSPRHAVLLAGSFNPLHRGHERLLAVAERISGREGWYELSVVNVDKPPLSREEVDRRAVQFRGKGNLVLTRAATFVEKAKLMPGTLFVVGFDTAARLFVEKYYAKPSTSTETQGAGPAVALAVRSLRQYEARFLVAGRVGADGEFRTLGSLQVPDEYRDIVDEVPEAVFRDDTSSTEIRARGH